MSLNILTIGEEGTKLTNIIQYLKKCSYPATDFVVRKFQSHPIVSIGEFHWIREQVNFVRNVIPIVHKKAGVTNIILEFGDCRKQKEIEMFLARKTFDETSKKLLFSILKTVDSPAGWGYKEYFDMFVDVWKYNQSLPKNKKKIKIYLVNFEEDIAKQVESMWLNAYEKWTRKTFSTFLELRKYWQKYPKRLMKVYKEHTNEFLALKKQGSLLSLQESRRKETNVVEVVRNILKNKEKALIYEGCKHTCFLAYKGRLLNQKNEIISGNGQTAGVLLKKLFPQKYYAILMHFTETFPRTQKKIRIANGIIDKACVYLKKTYIGFNLKSGPIGRLKRPILYTSIFPFARNKTWKFRDAYDGYIYLVRPEKYTPVKLIPHFFTNLQHQIIKKRIDQVANNSSLSSLK